MAILTIRGRIIQATLLLMTKPIISVSGMRGIVGESLDPQNVTRYVAAFAQELAPGPVILTRDGRGSGPIFAKSVAATLLALGHDVIDVGVAATPTLGVLVKQLNAAGGIQISASHNPIEYNGIKLFGPEGRVISNEIGAGVVGRMDDPIPWTTSEEVGEFSELEDGATCHIDRVCDTVDVELICQREFNVLLDSNRGSGSLAGRQLLQRLQTKFQILGDNPDGDFQHPPEPTHDNLQQVCERVQSRSFDVAFAQDPDADRLAIIDENGVYIGEEMTLALTLTNRLLSENGPCVINCATSRMSIDIANAAGCTCHLTAVGEANVCDEMLRTNAIYGGEGNGGPIDPKVGLVRDSFVGIAQVLELMARSNKTISQLVGEMPAYSICKQKIQINPDGLDEVYEKLVGKFNDAKSSRMDGIRFDWHDRWLLIRPSNTEPIVRVICETKSPQESAALAQSAIDIINV